MPGNIPGTAPGNIPGITAGGVTQTREVQAGHGTFGLQHDLDVTIGLGATCSIDSIEIVWPDAAGTTNRWTDVRANYRLVARQAEGLAYVVP